MLIYIDVITDSRVSEEESEIKSKCAAYLNKEKIKPGTIINHIDAESTIARCGIQCIIVEQFENAVKHFNEDLDYYSNQVRWDFYSLNDLEPQNEDLTDSSGDNINLSTNYILPNKSLFTLWESLIFEDGIKENLLNYASTIMEFSKRGVNFNLISCNKVMLLHGPPGTGKTSLCKALAQKLSVRLRSVYERSILIEINSHNLFSKWFSESGKLVTKMFERLHDICEMPNTLVCVLIDEVESLAHAREQCVNGNEPSDSFKVVNAVLTQIDRIKRFPNVLILTTSNIMCAIDVAFVDRADVKQFIGPPSLTATYKIFMSCIHELSRINVLDVPREEEKNNCRCEIEEISRECVKLEISGRMLRKLPFLAYALHGTLGNVSMSHFLQALSKAVKNEAHQRNILKSNGFLKPCAVPSPPHS